MNRHLAENEIAQYVDALVSNKQDQLPEKILEHVEECLECKKEIMDAWGLLEYIPLLPEFDNPNKQ
jgi:hypothetical protein